MRQALFDKLKRAFLVSLIILSVFGCAKEDPYTRMMWLEDLATSSGIYQDDVIGDMYAFGAIKDIDDLERELDIDYVAYTASNLSEKEFETPAFDHIPAHFHDSGLHSSASGIWRSPMGGFHHVHKS